MRLIFVQTGTPTGYRAMQNWIADDFGVMTPLGKVMHLPKGAIISSEDQLSPLLGANPLLSGTANFGALGTCTFAALRIRAGGLPDPSVSATNNFITVRAITDSAIPPVNYYTVRLDPVTGRAITYRP